MRNLAWIIPSAITLTAVGTALLYFFGIYGLILFVIVLFGFFFGLDRLLRWRSSRLARSMKPDETQVAHGLVSDSFWEQTPALLLRGPQKAYRLLVDDERQCLIVQRVVETLISKPGGSMKCIKLWTSSGYVHFAPRRGLFVAGQQDYAQNILDEMLASGLQENRVVSEHWNGD